MQLHRVIDVEQHRRLEERPRGPGRRCLPLRPRHARRERGASATCDSMISSWRGEVIAPTSTEPRAVAGRTHAQRAHLRPRASSRTRRRRPPARTRARSRCSSVRCSTCRSTRRRSRRARARRSLEHDQRVLAAELERVAGSGARPARRRQPRVRSDVEPVNITKSTRSTSASAGPRGPPVATARTPSGSPPARGGLRRPVATSAASAPRA